MIQLQDLKEYRETRDRLWDRNFAWTFLSDRDRVAVLDIFDATFESTVWKYLIDDPDYIRCKNLVNNEWNRTRNPRVQPKPDFTLPAETVGDMVGTVGEKSLDKYISGIFGG